MTHAGPRLRLPGTRSRHLVERNLLVARRGWLVILTGFVEPIIYLLGIGYGVGSLVGTVTGFEVAGLSYAQFVAPALMATSAMNGAIYESTFNLFWKLRYSKLYDTVLATPLDSTDVAIGEVTFALLRGGLYAVGFVAVMTALGLVRSPWAIATIPAAVLVGFAFAAVGVAATTWVRSWQDFDVLQLVLLPLFLFSATFYPLSRYPSALQVVVECSPLYRGVHLLRALTTGSPGVTCLLDVSYLLLLGALGVWVAARRLQRLLLR